VNALRRLLAALVLAGVLADASACIVAFAPAHDPAGQLSVSALCPCGCRAHTGALAGIGITQPGATPAASLLPDGPRVAPERGVPPQPPLAPVPAIDHVPIVLA